MSEKDIYILGIESSCDDTSAAVLKNDKVLSNIIANQDIHKKYGGVVPELASRAHLSNIIPTVESAIKEAKISLNQLSAISFTKGPGLMGSLIVGTEFSKALSLSLKIPVIEVNHMQAHILVHFINNGNIKPSFPFLGVTISGGHTQFILVKNYFEMEILGETLDDAIGEAFDKCGKKLGLGYPAGPLIDKLAKKGDEDKFKIHAFTTDKIIFFADNGRFFCVSANKLPSGRGFGEPISLTTDLKTENKIISCFPFFEGNIVLALDSGHGFKINTSNIVAQTKSGKQILNSKSDNKAKVCKKIEGDTVAVVGDNRKLLVYSIDEVPELNKGKGVILQRYKDASLSDVTTFNREDGLTWKMNGGRQRKEKDLLTWQGKRGGTGRMVPNGFPRPPKF